MPLALRDLQAAFAAHIMGADRADLVAVIAADTIPAAARLGVYRHHVFESLGKALAATFPTVQALVGPDFFRGLARAFVGHALPVQPVLSTVRIFPPSSPAAKQRATCRIWPTSLGWTGPSISPFMRRRAAGCRRRTFPPFRRSACRRYRSPWRLAPSWSARTTLWIASGRPLNPARRARQSI
jgi:hypothetical protein